MPATTCFAALRTHVSDDPIRRILPDSRAAEPNMYKLGLNDGWQLSLMFYHMIPSISIFLSNLVATQYLSFQYLIPTTVIDGKAYHSHSKSLSQVDCFLNELSDYQIDIQNGRIPRLLPIESREAMIPAFKHSYVVTHPPSTPPFFAVF